MLGDNRREEIFVSTADLEKRLDGLPLHAREVFAPLQLGGEPARPPADSRSAARPAVEPRIAPADRTPIDRRFDTESEARAEARAEVRTEARADPRPDPRHAHGRAVPPPAPAPETRSGTSRPPLHGPMPEPRRTAPGPIRAEAPVVDVPMFEDKSPPFATPRGDPTAPTAVRVTETRPATAPPRVERPPETAHEAGAKRLDDSALGEAIDRALDDPDGTSPR
jgi:hypothetical protein